MQIPSPVVSQASRLFDADPQELTLLGGMDGLAYEYSLQGKHFVLKIAPFPASDPQKPAQMAEKFAFVHYLAQNGVRVAAPVASINGKWVEEIIDGESRYTASAAAKVEGEHIGGRNPGSLTPEIFHKWGQVTGQIHRLSKQYTTWHCDDALPTLIGDWRKEHQSFADWCREDDIREKWHHLGDQLAELPIRRDCFGLVHNDLHSGNFFVKDGEITVIDFDVSAYHWYVMDIAIPLFFANWGGSPDRNQDKNTFLEGFLRSFLQGYRQETSLDPFWITRLPLFLKHHQILLYIVFTDEWRNAPDKWQTHTLTSWHRSILEDRPVIDLDFERLAHELD